MFDQVRISFSERLTAFGHVDSRRPIHVIVVYGSCMMVQFVSVLFSYGKNFCEAKTAFWLCQNFKCSHRCGKHICCENKTRPTAEHLFLCGTPYLSPSPPFEPERSESSANRPIVGQRRRATRLGRPSVSDRRILI